MIPKNVLLVCVQRIRRESFEDDGKSEHSARRRTEKWTERMDRDDKEPVAKSALHTSV